METLRSFATRVMPLACLIGASTLGCDAVSPDVSQTHEYLNPHKPNANSRILSGGALGDPASYSSIFDAMADDAGQVAINAIVDNHYGVGLLNPSGGLVHYENTTYVPRGLCGLAPGATVPNAFITVGAQNIDDDPESERGHASLFTHAGDLIDQMLFASDSSDVWLNSIAGVSDSTFVAVGGERRRGIPYPYIALLAVTAQRKLALRAATVLQSQPDGYFDGNVVVFPSSPGTNDLSLCALLQRRNLPAQIMALRATMPRLDAVTVEWTQEIGGQFGPDVTLSGIGRVGDNVVVVGQMDDNRKQPPPEDGGFWNSGFVASYTRQGAFRWLTVVPVSGLGDAFAMPVTTADGLYAVGHCASFTLTVESEPDHVFAYGLISRIDPSTGQVLYSMSLGNDRFRSEFNCATPSGDALVCAGWTEQRSSGGFFRAWSCRVQVGAFPLPPAAAALEPSDEARRARLGEITSTPAFASRAAE